jgi:hypothetical protein
MQSLPCNQLGAKGQLRTGENMAWQSLGTRVKNFRRREALRFPALQPIAAAAGVSTNQPQGRRDIIFTPCDRLRFF